MFFQNQGQTLLWIGRTLMPNLLFQKLKKYIYNSLILKNHI